MVLGGFRSFHVLVTTGTADAGSSQKHFLPFLILLNVGIDPNFPHNVFFFALFEEKFRFPAKIIFNLATFSAIICHIKSN